MLPKRVLTFCAIAVFVATLPSTLRTEAQDVAEAARKAKVKKQQQQPEASSASTPAKPKTFTNDDFPDSGGSGAGTDSRKIVGSAEPAGPGKDTGYVTLSLAHSTIKRPGGAEVTWAFKNTSDHWLNLTIVLVMDGPCGYHAEHPIKFRLNEHGGAGDSKTLGQMFYEHDCAGDYTFELRAKSFNTTLSTATTTLKVQ